MRKRPLPPSRMHLRAPASTLSRSCGPPWPDTPRSASKARIAPPDFNRLEGQILGLVVERLSNAAIADKVHLSQHTIKFHVHRILRQAGVTNRTELARKATQEGWL